MSSLTEMNKVTENIVNWSTLSIQSLSLYGALTDNSSTYLYSHQECRDQSRDARVNKS